MIKEQLATYIVTKISYYLLYHNPVYALLYFRDILTLSHFQFTVPPSYEDAMALSEKFSDDIEFLTNVSMSSIMSAQGDVTSEREPFKPRYPVYYDYETPTIPPGSDDSTESDT